VADSKPMGALAALFSREIKSDCHDCDRSTSGRRPIDRSAARINEIAL
jgi:hypothetical protein